MHPEVLSIVTTCLQKYVCCSKLGVPKIRIGYVLTRFLLKINLLRIGEHYHYSGIFNYPIVVLENITPIVVFLITP